MQHGHYAGPRRATWDVGECTLHYDYRNAHAQRSWHEAGLTLTADERTPAPLTVRVTTARTHQRINPTTGWYGVNQREYGRYQARFKLEGIVHHVGVFDDARTAARAHDTYCEAHGIDRKLNRELDETLTDKTDSQR